MELTVFFYSGSDSFSEGFISESRKTGIT